MVRKVIFKNTSNNKNQTKNISIPEITDADLAPILVGRTSITCNYDVKISKEEILLLVRPFSDTINTNNYNINYNNIIEDLIVGDTKRFILIEYEVDESDNLQSSEELFREQFVGMTQNKQYSNIRVNSTNNKFLNTNYAVNNNSIIKSVCTDGRYINSVSEYKIQVTQRMQNVTLEDFLDIFVVSYVDENLANTSIQRYTNLYIPRILENGYKLHANFFGVNNETISNRFWILPNEFKKNGITYEIFNSDDGINTIDPLPIFNNYNEFINKALQFSINNGILTINYDDSKIPKTQLFLPQHTKVQFKSIAPWDTNNISFNIEIESPVTGSTINTILYKPDSVSHTNYNLISSDFSNKNFSIKSITNDRVTILNDWYIDNIHNINESHEWKFSDNNSKKINLKTQIEDNLLHIEWPKDSNEFLDTNTIKNFNTKLIYNKSNFETDFAGNTQTNSGELTPQTFNIIKSTRNEVIIETITNPAGGGGTSIKLSFDNPANEKNGNLYFASYENITENQDVTGSLKAFGSGNIYDILITSIDGVVRYNNEALSFDDTITITKYSTLTSNTSFTFKNNFIDGIVGYYHELDNSKTIQNGTGFYDTGIADAKERVGSFIEQFVNIKWFSNILNSSLSDPSIYNNEFNKELDFNRNVDNPFYSSDGKFNFNIGSLSNEDFSKFTFRNINFRDITFTGCNFTDCQFLHCDFTNSTFEDTLFNNVYSIDCSFNNYIDDLTSASGKQLPFNNSFYNGKIITSDFSYNYSEYTTITFKDFDGSYNDKVTAFGVQNAKNKHITNFIDLSSNRVDYYNLRSLIKVESGYRFDISLTQLLINGLNGFDTEENKKIFYLHNKTNDNLYSDPKYCPLPFRNEDIERNLDTPVMFLIYENPIYYDIKHIEDYFNIELESPSEEIDISYIKIHDILPITSNQETTILSLYINELSNPNVSGLYNRIIDNNFYEHQFQKNLYNKNAPKICGIKSALTTDFKHNGNWEMLKHPYNSFGNEDTLCSYNIQTMNIQNKSLTDPPINTVNGPLSYYELDISFTDQILNDYPKRTDKDTLSRFSSLRLRKANVNYKYTERSTENSRIQYLATGNQNINHQVYSLYDLSFNQPPNPRYYQYIDYEI